MGCNVSSHVTNDTAAVIRSRDSDNGGSNRRVIRLNNSNVNQPVSFHKTLDIFVQ